MPRETTYILLGVTRKAVGEFPEWQQGLPQHTTAETAAYTLQFFKKILELGPSLFTDDSYHASFVAQIDAAIQTVNSGDLQAAATQIETQILPAVTQGVVPDNRIAFRDLLNMAIGIVAFPGEHYFTPPLDEILSLEDVTECCIIKVASHIGPERPTLECTDVIIDAHVEKIEPPKKE